MNTQLDPTRTQSLHRQRIVDLRGGGVVDGKGANRRQGQVLANRRCFQPGKTGSLGEVLQQEALPVKLVG